jgi:hypothetical protein
MNTSNFFTAGSLLALIFGLIFLYTDPAISSLACNSAIVLSILSTRSKKRKYKLKIKC